MPVCGQTCGKNYSHAVKNKVLPTGSRSGTVVPTHHSTPQRRARPWLLTRRREPPAASPGPPLKSPSARAGRRRRERDQVRVRATVGSARRCSRLHPTGQKGDRSKPGSAGVRMEEGEGGRGSALTAPESPPCALAAPALLRRLRVAAPPQPGHDFVQGILGS